MDSTTNDLGQPIGWPVTQSMPAEWPPVVELVGAYCSVRPLDAAHDHPLLFAAFSADAEGRGWTYLPHGPFDDPDEFAAWLEACGRSSDPVFFVVDDGGGPCGIASYLRAAPASGSVEVGYLHFAPRLQRSIASTEAMFLMMRNAFDAGYRRYEWKCDALNEASRAAALRLGFTFEGEFRQATVYKGRNRDTAWFSIIDAEWPQRRAEFERWLSPQNFDESGVQRSPLRHD